MNEPAVAITDYALTIENAVLAVLLWRAARKSAPAADGRRLTRTARWFVVFFSMISVSSLLGGTFHGFMIDETMPAGRILWQGVMLSIGAAALAGANAAACMWREKMRKVVAAFALAAFLAYFAVVLFVTQDFRYAIFIYLPSTLFLLVSFVFAYLRTRAPGLLLGAFGLALTFYAAKIQQSEASLPGLYLDHNALYHIVQAFALVLVYLGARAALQIESGRHEQSVAMSGGR